MTPLPADKGIISIPSAHSVDEPVGRLQSLLQAKDIKLFALIDHSGEAEKAGLHMPNTKLLIFGNPKAGTSLMLAEPTTAIDLPLKILIAEAADGSVSVSWTDPAWLQQRHGFPPEFVTNIAAVEALAKQSTKKA